MLSLCQAPPIRVGRAWQRLRMHWRRMRRDSGRWGSNCCAAEPDPPACACVWSGIVTNVSSGNRRYLALWFPFLSADRLLISGLSAVQPDTPLALVEKVRGAMRLMAVDQTALALGLAPGLMLADARARVPDLEVADHDSRADQDRSEEHTSELQALMRISYAVFCLKKKKTAVWTLTAE